MSICTHDLRLGQFNNTWLVLGTFDNDTKNTGYERDWIGEATVEPREGMVSAGKVWRYFDDRLFSRNYDDYQDLFSYFKVKRGENVAAKVAYAHIYVHSSHLQKVQLRIGAHNAFRTWVNGELVAESTKSCERKDMVKASIELRPGWNRLLLKIVNQSDGRFGFYACFCDEQGQRLSGLTFSVNGGNGKLKVSTKRMSDIGTGDLPIAYREWPYVRINEFFAVDEDLQRHGSNLARIWESFFRQCLSDGVGEEKEGGSYLRSFLKRRPDLAVRSSEFVLMAEGGVPPYEWSLVEGQLPDGLQLLRDGTIEGVVSADTVLGKYRFCVQVVDANRQTATKWLTLIVKERPNKWYEEARLTALIHAPEKMPEGEFSKFARLMKHQGYGSGVVISYNNGDYRYRYPSVYAPGTPDLVGKYKVALETEGLHFGIYLGEFTGSNHGGENGAILLIDEVMRRYNPSVMWLDWGVWEEVHSVDAFYSVIRTHNPNTVIVLNSIWTLYMGDWDIIVLEPGENRYARPWDLFPFPISWVKRTAVENWRPITDPLAEFSKGVYPDWQEYLRVQISLIGAGFIANIDHSPTLRQEIATLDESIVMQCHQKMMKWANPEGIPPLHESYTKVNPAPLNEDVWGYSVINLARDIIYLHMVVNPYGKTGKPDTNELIVCPVKQIVKGVVWMNKNKPLPFRQKGALLHIDLDGVESDTVDTIIKIKLIAPYPEVR